MQTLTIPVSDSIFAAANMDKDEMAHAMLNEFAVKLFREGRLSLEQSADFCNITIYDFLAVLSHAGVSVIDYDPEELKKEIADFPRL